MKTLILTVGLPCSGKSTWAQSTGYPVVSSDAIRLAFFGKLWSEPHEYLVLSHARTMVRTLFFAGHGTVIWDSVNITRALRTFWKPSPDLVWTRDYEMFLSGAPVCKWRARKTGKSYLRNVIDKMRGYYEPVESNEYGFVTISGRHEYDFVPGALL